MVVGVVVFGSAEIEAVVAALSARKFAVYAGIRAAVSAIIVARRVVVFCTETPYGRGRPLLLNRTPLHFNVLSTTWLSIGGEHRIVASFPLVLSVCDIHSHSFGSTYSEPPRDVSPRSSMQFFFPGGTCGLNAQATLLRQQWASGRTHEEDPFSKQEVVLL